MYVAVNPTKVSENFWNSKLQLMVFIHQLLAPFQNRPWQDSPGVSPTNEQSIQEFT